MRLVSKEEALAVKAGSGHYHWKCADKLNFISTTYKTMTQAAKKAQKHIDNYPAHAKKVSVAHPMS